MSARTGGVPLFVEEVTRLLLERGEQGGVQAIPPTLQQSLAARLDRLGSARSIYSIRKAFRARSPASRRRTWSTCGRLELSSFSETGNGMMGNLTLSSGGTTALSTSSATTRRAISASPRERPRSLGTREAVGAPVETGATAAVHTSQIAGRSPSPAQLSCAGDGGAKRRMGSSLWQPGVLQFVHRRQDYEQRFAAVKHQRIVALARHERRPLLHLPHPHSATERASPANRRDATSSSCLSTCADRARPPALRHGLRHQPILDCGE